MGKFGLETRKRFHDGDEIRDKGLTTPLDIERFDDISYGPLTEQKLDVYRPKGNDEVLPVIVSVHGGGWVYGDKERYQYYCMSLAQFGFAVVNYTYRLAPENLFPSSIEDMVLAFNWVKENAKEHKLNPDKVFAVGDSAGGAQLGIYANMTTNPGYAKRFPFKPLIKPIAVALNCGHYDYSEAKFDDAYLNEFMPVGWGEEELDLIDVNKHITSDFPPAFIMTANKDFLFHDATLIVQALAKKGVNFVYRCYGTKEKPLEHVFHCNMYLKEAHICNKDETDFFKSFL